jgi:hypothetical protein
MKKNIFRKTMSTNNINNAIARSRKSSRKCLAKNVGSDLLEYGHSCVVNNAYMQNVCYLRSAEVSIYELFLVSVLVFFFNIIYSEQYPLSLECLNKLYLILISLCI